MNRLWMLALVWAVAAQVNAAEPVFDVHLHALPADHQGPPPLAMCTPWPEFPAWDPATPYPEVFMALMKEPPCDNPVWSPETDDAVMQRTISEMEKHNVFGVLGGSPDRVQAWMAAAPGRFLPGLDFDVASSEISVADMRELVVSRKVQALAEVTNQYSGVAPDDERMAPFWALAEELDVPVGIHIGTGPPGVFHLGADGYRARLHSALTLEPVLVRHPRLRVYVTHAGFPMLDDLLAMLYAHPQLHVGTGVIVYSQQPAAFYRYLEAIVDAGFAGRIMFGSDQMVWPETIGRSIRVIEDAPFLNAAHKRDILYNNAARFFRFDAATRKRHHETP